MHIVLYICSYCNLTAIFLELEMITCIIMIIIIIIIQGLTTRYVVHNLKNHKCRILLKCLSIVIAVWLINGAIIILFALGSKELEG